MKRVLKNRLQLFLCSAFLFSCGYEKNEKPLETADTIIKEVVSTIVDSVFIDTIAVLEYSPREDSLLQSGLVDVQKMDSTILIDLKYSSTDNFLKADVYEDINHCFIQPDVAQKLSLAQMLLRAKYPDWSLKVFDGARPKSVQQKMWNMLQMPVSEKVNYVSNPKNGSVHNYGAAVDLTIVNESNEELDMGTAYDFFGEKSYPKLEDELLKKGELTELQVSNRRLLREVMNKAGFRTLPTEWWHFNSCSRDEAMIKYKLIE